MHCHGGRRDKFDQQSGQSGNEEIHVQPCTSTSTKTLDSSGVVSRGYATMFENWLYFYKLLALEMQVLLFAEDEASFKMYRARNDIVTRAGRFSDHDSESKEFHFGGSAFRKLVSNRPGYILEAMQSFPNVIYTDVDTVWLTDPRPFLVGEHDVWTSLDEEHGDYRVYCTGFMAFQATKQSVGVLQMWAAELSKKPDLDQPVWNRLLGQNKVNVGALPRHLFPPGIMYFGVSTLASLAYLRSSESNTSVAHIVPWTDRVVVVHNNWIIGREAKVQRFKDSGLWKVNSSSPSDENVIQECNDVLLQLAKAQTALAETKASLLRERRLKEAAQSVLAQERQSKQALEHALTVGRLDKEFKRSHALSPCALLFFGVPKRFKEVVLPSIRRHITSINPECDVFMHMYNLTVFTNPRNGEENVQMHPDEAYLFTEAIEIMSETEHDFRRRRNVTEYEKFFPFHTHDDWLWPMSLHNMLKQWHSIENVWDLMLSHERRTAKLYTSRRLQYQRIGLFRSDVVYQNDIDISDGDAILPLFSNYHGYMNDRMFYGLRNFSERWACGRFDYVDQYMRTDFGMRYRLHSESYMFHRMGHWQVPIQYRDICFYRVRMTGKTMDDDCSDRQAPTWKHDYPLMNKTGKFDKFTGLGGAGAFDGAGGGHDAIEDGTNQGFSYPSSPDTPDTNNGKEHDGCARTGRGKAHAGAAHTEDETLTPKLFRASELSLSDLMKETDTDKVWRHGYHRFYEALLDPLRYKMGLRMLEIGVDFGRSMATWVKYFENAANGGIQGVAYNATGVLNATGEFATSACAKNRIPGCEKINFFSGDQSDVDFLDRLIREGAGVDPAPVLNEGKWPDWDQAGWDLVIDDGSHLPRHQLTSFVALYPFVRPGGLYVIEDIESSYLDHPDASVYGYKIEGGGVGKRPPGNFVEKMKQLIDVVNRNWFYHPEFSILGKSVDHSIRSITFAGGMLWVQKSFASDKGYPTRLALEEFKNTASEAVAQRMREVALEEPVAVLRHSAQPSEVPPNLTTDLQSKKRSLASCHCTMATLTGYWC